MKVNLIQIDGKMPNLALMKLATWHKNKGDDVRIIDLSSLQADRWYGSKIFMGGSGYDVKQKLPEEIELQVPDYDLFKTDYSIGFTSRGCMRNCGFCIVKEKEGNLKECDMNFIKHQKVILWDNNFLASPNWKEKLQYFIDNKIKVSFNQGLDIRLITKLQAEMLAKVKYYDLNFNQRRLYFAWDNPENEKDVLIGIDILKEAGVKPEHLMFYVLVGYNTTFEQDYHRFEVLKDLKVKPFIMLYNNCKDKKLRAFSRYVNKRYYQIVSWEDYKKSETSNQKHIGKNE